MKTKNKQPFLRFIFIVIGQIFSITLMAQSNLRFEELDLPDVPLFANIDCFYQDSRSFMWFGSCSGLFMYDGYCVKQFQNNPKAPLSISDNKITRILEDNKGNLWALGTTATIPENGFFDY